MSKKADRRTLDVTFTLLGLAVTVILFVAGCIGMYAYWTFGLIAYYASILALTGSAVMLLLVILGYRHILGAK